MAYVRNPVYLGVGAIDAADRASILRKEEWLRSNFKGTYAALTKIPPASLQTLVKQLNTLLATLPPEKRSQILASASALKNSDLRAVTGLGQPAVGAVVQAADWSSKLANIAGVIASLTTVGFGVAQFIEQKKSSKEQQALQDRQQKMAEEQMAQDLKERQARLDAAKAQTTALTEQQQAAAKQKELDASGYMMTPDGQIVPKPKNTALTVGAVGAAVAGAFLMSK
jgi:hypothetical protein